MMRSFIKGLVFTLGVSLVMTGLLAGGASAVSPYGGLKNGANRKPVLPRTIVLTEQGRDIRLSPKQLGWRLDTRKIDTAARRKSLPLDNPLASGPFAAARHTRTSTSGSFFSEQVIPAYTTLDQATLLRQVTEVASATQRPAVDARIVTQGGNYTISPEAAGSRVDIPKAAAAVQVALARDKTVVDLPMTPVLPLVTAASLQPQLQQMKARQAAIAATAGAVTPHSCADNPAGRQLILVNLSQQHLWACSGSDQAYDTAITSGAYLAGDATPTGTWHIYAKTTNVNLIGPGWDDFVNYWMPFYSDYGFHDSSWQTFPYGSPQYASDGSHGCVHLPPAAMAWLYGWASIGATVTITG